MKSHLRAWCDPIFSVLCFGKWVWDSGRTLMHANVVKPLALPALTKHDGSCSNWQGCVWHLGGHYFQRWEWAVFWAASLSAALKRVENLSCFQACTEVPTFHWICENANLCRKCPSEPIWEYRSFNPWMRRDRCILFAVATVSCIVFLIHLGNCVKLCFWLEVRGCFP